MIQVISKWMVTATYESQAATIIFIHDNFYSNVLKKLSDISFINEPVLIEIKKLENSTQVGVSY